MTQNSKLESVKISPNELMGPLNDIETKFAPSYLFIKGNRELINDTRPRVAIIGTRHPSERGINNARILTRFLVQHGVIIVSGLALGIDSIAHRTAIDNDGKTIAVLGTPLDTYYPKQNQELQDEIAKNHLIISQFPAGTPIQIKNFPMRNRTMALLSHASIIIEATDDSGTLHQGWEALRLGRPLFIVEDILKHKELTWPHKLMEYGAKILPMSSIEIVLESLPHLITEVDNCVTF